MWRYWLRLSRSPRQDEHELVNAPLLQMELHHGAWCHLAQIPRLPLIISDRHICLEHIVLFVNFDPIALFVRHLPRLEVGEDADLLVWAKPSSTPTSVMPPIGPPPMIRNAKVTR